MGGVKRICLRRGTRLVHGGQLCTLQGVSLRLGALLVGFGQGLTTFSCQLVVTLSLGCFQGIFLRRGARLVHRRQF